MTDSAGITTNKILSIVVYGKANTVVGSVDVNRAGTYWLAYTTKDSQGAVGTAISRVKVEAKKVTKAEKSEKREKSSKSKKSGKR